MELRTLSLCSGIGALDLGVRLAVPGARTVCYVEREAYCQAALVARMEEAALDSAPVWDDLKTFDGKPWRGRVDCVTGGYPCQPFSMAGSRQGSSDPRHLWPDVCRIVEEIQPEIVFFENVHGHLSLGFEKVVSDLERLDYRVAAGLFTAEEVGAPHDRKRLFILGRHSSSVGQEEVEVGDPDSSRLARWLESVNQDRDERSAWPSGPEDDAFWRRCPVEAQPAVHRMAHGSSLWVDRLRAVGNSVVPAQAAFAFRTLASYL